MLLFHKGQRGGKGCVNHQAHLEDGRGEKEEEEEEEEESMLG